jgi:hypothetical protein|tara:strand:- start:703 stop:1197 length:495 start_codon:yes stop_codon:yes gene_type:complete
MAQRTKINTGNTLGGVYKCICGLRYDGAGDVHVFALSDPNNLFKGITFNPNGNNNSVEEWNFVWDDTSVVRAIMEGGGTAFVNHNAGVLEGNSTTLLDIRYLAHKDEEIAVASVCFIDDPYTPDAMLWAPIGTLASGSFHTPSEIDWIEITLIVPSGLIPVELY